MQLTLSVTTDNELLTHYVQFGLRPLLFIPGHFDPSIVSGFHPLKHSGSSLELIEAQVRVFFITPVGVIDPFVAGVTVSLIMDHLELFDLLETRSMQNPQNTGSSLLQCAPEEIHDRFALSP